MKRMKEQGFTLIELLIVIGLLGALTALVLPSLSADREEAIGSVCDYNQAGTIRTLKEFVSVYGVYPDQMHNGMTSTSVTISSVNGTLNDDGTEDDAGVMPGIPAAQSVNIGGGASSSGEYSTVLTANEVTSLKNAGISNVAAGGGYHVSAIDTSTRFLSPYNGSTYWKDDADTEYSFDGILTEHWEAGTDGSGWTDSDGSGEVIVLWITPTVNWEVTAENANNDWTGGAVKMEISLEGQCPVPAEGLSGDPEFAYYMAYFKVYDTAPDGTTDGSDDDIPAAKLIGTSCPECGIINP